MPSGHSQTFISRPLPLRNLQGSSGTRQPSFFTHVDYSGKALREAEYEVVIQARRDIWRESDDPFLSPYLSREGEKAALETGEAKPAPARDTLAYQPAPSLRATALVLCNST